MNTLPREIVLKIFSHCDERTIYNLMFLNSIIRSLLKQNRRIIRGSVSVQELWVTFDPDCIHLQRVIQKQPTTSDKDSPQKPNKLNETKKIKWSDTTAEEIWDHIWYMEADSIILIIRDSRFADVLNNMPDSWLARTSKIRISCWFEFDIPKFVVKLRECSSFHLDIAEPRDTINSIIASCRQINNFRINVATKRLFCDDTTLDLLIMKSKEDRVGLANFWIFSCPHKYTLEKIKEFIKSAKFASNVTLYLGSIEGKKDDFLTFLQEDNAVLTLNRDDIYMFTMNSTEFALNISNFIE